jgi:hypothetical protein
VIERLTKNADGPNDTQVLKRLMEKKRRPRQNTGKGEEKEEDEEVGTIPIHPSSFYNPGVAKPGTAVPLGTASPF